jgi:hypothetical protein
MKFRRVVSLFILLTAVVAGAVAQDKTIDDFTTGAYQSPSYKNGSHTSIQSGSMMGGSRDTGMSICDTTVKGQCAAINPYSQPSSYGFFPAKGSRAASMVQTAGYYAPPRIDMGYGFQSPMDENFGAYQKIRINFSGLSQPLNFNILLFTGTAHAQGGCNLPAYSGPFSAELPLSLFAVQSESFDFAHVTAADVIFQSGSVIGNVGFGVTSIELTNTTKSGIVIDCHY